jgi:hypothetical protein
MQAQIRRSHATNHYLAAFFTISALALTPVAASAQSVGVTVGTQGIGIEAGTDISPMFAIRANVNYFRISRGVDGDDVAYDGRLRLMSVGLLGDYFPFDNGFHLTGGAYLNRNRVNISATPTGNVEIGGTTYTPAQIGRLDGRVAYRDLAPYAGLGYTSRRDTPGLAFTFDAGALFQGSSRVRLASTGGTLSNAAAFNADIERERADIRDDVDSLKIYPAIKVGLAYRF